MSAGLSDFLASRAHEQVCFDPARFQRIYKAFGAHFEDRVPKIQIIGTNGKGSTGRFIAMALEQAGFKTLHFSSPHLIHFAERFYRNGQVVDEDALEQAHRFLQTLSLESSISYFEYATLLAVVLSASCDYMVVEAGLGGEFDSTTSLKNRIALVFTPISIDHTDRLGTTLSTIASTKLKAMQTLKPQTPIILAPQEPQVLQQAKQIAQSSDLSLILVPPLSQEAKDYGTQHNYPPFLTQNFQTALTTLKALDIHCDPCHLGALNLRGRFERLAANTILDVAHNVSGAQALSKALQKGQQKVNLVYNSYARKDAWGVLACLKPLIERVWILEVDDSEIIKRDVLHQILRELGVTFQVFSWEDFRAMPGCLWVVTGSFSVVGAFMQAYGCTHAR